PPRRRRRRPPRRSSGTRRRPTGRRCACAGCSTLRLQDRSGGCGRTGPAAAGAPLRARGAPGAAEVRGAGADRTPPPSTEALRGVVLLARRPPPPSMEPLRGAVFSARLTLSPGGDGSPAFRLDHGCGELPGAAGVGQPEGERPVHVAELGDRPVVAPLGAADLVHA